jgi:DNA primase
VQERYRTGIDFEHRDRVVFDGQERWVEQPRIVIPHFWTGILVGWQKRLASPHGVGPKYVSSPGFPKTVTLFNFDLADPSSVVVVESPMSVLVMVSRGIDAVATFGASVSEEQVRIMKEFDEVTLWFDDDTAGRKALFRVSRALVGSGVSAWYVPLSGKNDGTDPADLSEEEMRARLADRRPIVSLLKEEGDVRKANHREVRGAVVV